MDSKEVLDGDVVLERRGGDRRGGDRRKVDVPVDVERRQGPRRKVQRRRQIDPTTCERDYSSDELEFMQALDAYKRSSGRMFPTCSEILEVIRGLGYVRIDTPKVSRGGDEGAGEVFSGDSGSLSSGVVPTVITGGVTMADGTAHV